MTKKLLLFLSAAILTGMLMLSCSKDDTKPAAPKVDVSKTILATWKSSGNPEVKIVSAMNDEKVKAGLAKIEDSFRSKFAQGVTYEFRNDGKCYVNGTREQTYTVNVDRVRISDIYKDVVYYANYTAVVDTVTQKLTLTLNTEDCREVAKQLFVLPDFGSLSPEMAAAASGAIGQADIKLFFTKE